MQARWLLAGLVLVVLATAWVAWPRGDVERPSPGEASARGRGVPAREPLLGGAAERSLPEPSTPRESAGGTSGAAAVHPVTVLDDGGRPVAGAEVRIRRRSFSMFGGMVTEAVATTDATGVAEVPAQGKSLAIPPLGAPRAPDSIQFDVVVLPPRDRLLLSPLSGAVWPPVAGALRLESGGMVTGFVTDLEGRSLADVVVDAGVHERSTDRTDEAGAFRIPQLPLGEHELRLHVPGLPELAARRWPVSAGQSAVHLAVDVGASLRVEIPAWEARRDGDMLRIAPAPAEPDYRLPPREIRIRDAVFTIYGLDENETYTLHLPAGPAGRVGWGPRVGAWAKSVALPLRPSVVLEGTLEVPRGFRAHGAHVEARSAGMTFPGSVGQLPGRHWLWRLEDLPTPQVELIGWVGNRVEPEARGVLRTVPGGANTLRLHRVR